MQVLNNLTQGSEEWLKARMGVITASRFKDVVTPARGDLSKSRVSYMYELIAERMGAENEFFKNDYMKRGNELEELARSTYSFVSNNEVYEVGMILRDDSKVGISPDGLIGGDGGLEIKCPKASTHVKYMLKGELPLEYKCQVQGSLWISGREWWDFMSFHPQLPPFILRVYRDEEFIEKMESHINNFVLEVDKATKQIS